MTRLLVAAALAVSACAAPAAVTTTTAPVPRTEPVAPVTTAAAPIEVVVQGCSSPPVTFSPLCETYQLLETWHVDAPLDPDSLASVALQGLEGLRTDQVEEPPRTLFCSIPHEAFSGLCDELARQVTESQIPVGLGVETAMTHMIDAGLDPFTYYVPPDQAGAIRLNGIVGGVGVLLDSRDAVGSKCAQISGACRLEIVVVLEDNAGFDAGLAPGDIVVSVDGVPVEGMGFGAVVAAIAGDETGFVRLGVERDGSAIDFEIERRELVVPTVELGLPLDDVAYLRIPDFEDDVPRLVDDALAELADTDPGTLVLDLRDNPGGYVDAVVEVADQFVDDGVVMVSDAPDDHFEYEATAGGAALDPRLVVLVNEGTASAAEVLAGALRDRRDAVIVGTSTFGKDAVQIPFVLRNGGELHVAVARWSTPDGDTVGDGGLSPDREVIWPSGITVEEVVEIALQAAP